MPFKSNKQRKCFFAKLRGRTINLPQGKAIIEELRNNNVQARILTGSSRGVRVIIKSENIVLSKKPIKQVFRKSKFKTGQTVILPDGRKGTIIKRTIAPDNPFLIRTKEGVKFFVTEKNLKKV